MTFSVATWKQIIPLLWSLGRSPLKCSSIVHLIDNGITGKPDNKRVHVRLKAEYRDIVRNAIDGYLDTPEGAH